MQCQKNNDDYLIVKINTIQLIMKTNLWIVIPCYNEEENISRVVDNLIENYPAETNRQKFLKARDMAILDEFKKFFLHKDIILHCMKKSGT